MHGLEHQRGPGLSDHPALTSLRRGSRGRSRSRLPGVLSWFAVVALLAAAAGTVGAHDGALTSMEIPAERLPPGSTLPLIGLDFFPGEALQIRLTGPGGATELGVVRAGPDGHFESFLDLPADLPAGPYTVDAISQSGIIIRALVTIDPAAPPASYDPLFSTAAERSPAPDVDLVPFAAAGLALVALGLLVLRTRRSTAIR
jgi:hypothetical protein